MARRRMKQPQIRKQEILNGAMALFAEHGYEETSMRDIAEKLQISLGLCYRYFDNKQALFQAAMAQYVKEICADYLKILHDQSVSFTKKLDYLYVLLRNEEKTMQYHEFFHRPENIAYHEALAIQLCHYMIPHIKEELERYCSLHHYKLQNESVLLSFLTYGQIGIHANIETLDEQQCSALRTTIETLIQLSLIPDTE